VSRPHPNLPLDGMPGAADLDARLESLSVALESSMDVRALVVAPPAAEIDALVAQLQRLTALLAAREHVPEFDGADQVAIRITLQTLSAIAVHLRRIHAAAAPTITAALEPSRKARRLAARQRRQLNQQHDSPEA
jgi:hypothetical protein